MWAPARARHWFGPREVASGAVGPMGTKTLCPPLAMTGPPPPGGGCADGLRDPMDAAAGAHARARPQPLPDGGQGKAGQKEDEDTLLDGAVQLAHVQQRAERTRGKLMAVLHYHVAVGYPDPLELAPRLWLALEGLRRSGGKQNRKYPQRRTMQTHAKQPAQSKATRPCNRLPPNQGHTRFIC
ncbi:unnamed protein product [Prorocentrum cordatum]|uniref:Uncharacterized protein n=1 Tax=Prorocentrum cordatum TaxID=2364126 RepID=A0ABN9RTS9_9DINO|nr:unnamed protein product [Polarella glacialis]